MVCLLDLHLESLEGLHVFPDLLDWELDKHTSDLWSFLWSDDHVNVVEDQVTDLILVVWVSVSDGWKKLLSAHHVLLLWGEVLWNLLHSWGTWHSTHLSGIWIGWHTWLSWHWLWSHWHLTWSLWHLVHLLHVWHVSVLVVWSSLSILTSKHSSVTLVHSVVHGLVLLDESKKLLNDLGEVWVA